MNVLTIISFILATAVFIGGLRMASADLSIFIDFPSMFIVIGGSLTATAIGFHLNKLFALTKLFLLRTIKGKHIDMTKIVTELILAVDALKKGKSISQIKDDSNDFFFKESLELLEDGILNKVEVIEILNLRKEKLAANYMEDASKLKSISKFPPAFGMIGTTIGMIVLLANLGGEDAMKMIGPAMGVCLITTLYGAVIANMTLIPMAENLTVNTKEIYKKNEIIIEAISLIMEKASPVLAAEKLNSHLLPSGRVNWKDVIKG